MHSLFDHDDFKHEFEYTKTLPWLIVHRCLWMIKFILTNEYVSQMNDPDIYKTHHDHIYSPITLQNVIFFYAKKLS